MRRARSSQFLIQDVPDLTGHIAIVTGGLLSHRAFSILGRPRPQTLRMNLYYEAMSRLTFRRGTGNSGIGYETSLQLARHHARVYIAGRSLQRLQEAIASMKAAVPPGQELDLHLLEIDLGDLQSVKDAAERFQQQESKLHLLINNAGVG